MAVDSITYGDSPVSVLLANAFNSSTSARKLCSKFGRIFDQYTSGLSDIIFISNKNTRDEVLRMWHKRYDTLLIENLSEEFKKNDISITIAQNVFHAKLQKYIDHGDIIERLNASVT